MQWQRDVQSFVEAQWGCPMLSMTLMNLSVRMSVGVGEGSHGNLLEGVAPLLSWKDNWELAGKERLERGGYSWQRAQDRFSGSSMINPA